jgi:hypothetical protein
LALRHVVAEHLHGTAAPVLAGSPDVGRVSQTVAEF